MRDVLEFHVYDAEKWEFGGVRVQDHEGVRKVRLTAEAARFWIDQGLIGEKSMDERSEKAQGVAAQITGTAPEIPPADEPEARGKPGRARP